MSLSHSTSAPAARGGGPPPLAHQLGHHLAGGGARELEIARVVRAAQLDGVDAVELLEIVVAHVVEVPAGAEVPAGPGVALDAGLRARMVHRELGLVGHVGERQAFAGEADLGAARVLDRAGSSR